MFRTDLFALMHPDSRETFRSATKRALASDQARCTVQVANSEMWINCIIRNIGERDIAGTLACYVRDYTAEHELEMAEQAAHQEGGGIHDQQTGLLTYHSLETLIGGRLGRDGGTLALVDIDGYDTLQDVAKRQAVEHVAAMLHAGLPRDSLLARCGEGLFAAFLPGATDRVEVRAKGCEAIDALRSAPITGGEKITCSMGLSSIGASSQVRLGIMYRRALRALTIAKVNGGDAFLLYDTVRDEVKSGIEVFGVQLRHAPDGELLPQKALEGADLFNVISRDFKDRPPRVEVKGARTVRDTVFGALRYRSMAEVPGILSFDYDIAQDCIHLESVDENEAIYHRTLERFAQRLFEYSDFIASESLARLSTLLADLEYLPVSGNVDLKCKLVADEDFRWYRFSFTSLRDDKSFVIRGLGYGEDIDLSRESGRWWKDRAMHDGLTGLLNREGLEDAVDHMLVKQPGGMMFMVDIDDFKVINDRLGHLSGDAVLCELADTLLATFRDNDAVGRFGSDEMVAFISNINSRELAAKRAEALVSMAHDIVAGSYGSISVSVGVGLLDGKASFYDFLELADHALHAAKAAGKDGFCIAGMQERAAYVHSMVSSEHGGRSERGRERMQVEARYNRERAEQ